MGIEIQAKFEKSKKLVEDFEKKLRAGEKILTTGTGKMSLLLRAKNSFSTGNYASGIDFLKEALDAKTLPSNSEFITFFKGKLQALAAEFRYKPYDKAA
ncbi:MAG TPA: hypothetical protein VLB02_01790 [Candidatus Paceibacterota bacterium]|nr:hypothetical protein [Candidatus Paceibacterota bacterium]